ncbi:MAG TPA: hemolysin family protein [Longimicrobiales bacterium]
MDPASTVLKLIAVLALIGINGYLVAARSAFSLARRSRLEPLARGGAKRAQRVLAELDAPDAFLAGARLGSALATIGIGWIAETSLHGLIVDRLGSIAVPGDTSLTAHVLATAVTLLLVGWLHASLGERVPRLLAAQEPERVVLRTLGPTRLIGRILRPLLWLSSRTAAVLLRMLGRSAVAPHAAPEIRLLVEQAPEGTVESDQEQMLLGVYHLRDTLAREVMTPRRDIVALPVTATRAETLALVAEEGHSRIPVYAESIDDITGVLLVKDLLTHITREGADEVEFDLARLVREPYFVPDTKRIGELLPELRTKSVHMAIVLDEFGGTDGLVTLEDMLEEIVGDIYDEHDIPEEETDFEITDAGEVLIDGGASIFDVNERFGLALPERDYDTIGGYVFGELGRVPIAGDVVVVDDGAGELRVDEVEERRVTRVRLILKPAPIPDESEHTVP